MIRKIIASNTLVRFRKLRIAWSVGCAIACVLLIALWARSYWWWDQLYTPICLAAYESPSWEGRIISIESASGVVSATWTTGGDPWYWHISYKLGDERYAISPYGSVQTQDVHKSFVGFAAYREFGINPTISIPIWFTALTMAALGYSSWLPWWSNRFSVRTLLIATTIIAVVLGLIVAVLR